MDLTELVSIPATTVYGFLNHQTKVCQIFYSTSTLCSLARHIAEYNNIIKRDNLEVKIIETVTGDVRLRHAYWCDYYKRLGYKFYNNPRPLSFTLKHELATDPRHPTRYLWFVYLVNKVPQKLIVGVFEKHQQMRQFIKDNYPKRRIYEVKYDTGELTQTIKELYER